MISDANAAALERRDAEAVKVFHAVKKHITYVRPPCYPKQEEAIFNPTDNWHQPARYSWIEASTKAGKTRGCIAWLAEQAALKGSPGKNYWWVAPVFPQADIAYKRMKRALPKWMVLKTNDTDKYIIILNGATIWFKSGEKPDNLYGEDVYAAVIDEASRVREESFHAVRSTLTFTQGHLRCIGNVKGRKNWFYKAAHNAKGGKPDHAYYKMTAYDAVEGGVFPLSEIEDARAVLPDHAFKQLYLAEPADDGGNPFGLAAIQRCIRPLSDEAPFAMGVDFAKSIDWTVVHALDRAGNTCGHERWQRVGWGVTTPRVKNLIGSVPTLADRTGVGDPIVEELMGYNPRLEGFLFTGASKQELMVGLASAIQKEEVGFPRGVIVDELESFEYEYTPRGVRYSAPEGAHDDCVIALALAVEQRRRLMPVMRSSEAKGPVAASQWLPEEQDEIDPDDM
jgi:phage FluMu gp28-like protein